MSNYNTEKKKHKVKSHSVGMILPLYIFTIPIVKYLLLKDSRTMAVLFLSKNSVYFGKQADIILLK